MGSVPWIGVVLLGALGTVPGCTTPYLSSCPSDADLDYYLGCFECRGVSWGSGQPEAFQADVYIDCQYPCSDEPVDIRDGSLVAGGELLSDPEVSDTGSRIEWTVGMPVFPAEVIVEFSWECDDRSGRDPHRPEGPSPEGVARATMPEDRLVEVGDAADMDIEDATD